MAASPHIATYIRSLIFGATETFYRSHAALCELPPASSLSMLQLCLRNMPNLSSLTIGNLQIHKGDDARLVECFQDTFSRLKILSIYKCISTTRFLASSIASCIHSIEQLHISWVTLKGLSTIGAPDPNFVSTCNPTSLPSQLQPPQYPLQTVRLASLRSRTLIRMVKVLEHFLLHSEKSTSSPSDLSLELFRCGSYESDSEKADLAKVLCALKNVLVALSIDTASDVYHSLDGCEYSYLWRTEYFHPLISF